MSPKTNFIQVCHNPDKNSYGLREDIRELRGSRENVPVQTVDGITGLLYSHYRSRNLQGHLQPQKKNLACTFHK